MPKQQKAKVVVFGPWMQKDESGDMQPSEEGRLIYDWLSGKSIDELDQWANVAEFEKLLRKEIQANKDYLEYVKTELQLFRNELLDQANAQVPKLSKPTASLIEAYNNGLEMGRHWRPVEIAQRLSDIIDKMLLVQVCDE